MDRALTDLFGHDSEHPCREAELQHQVVHLERGLASSRRIGAAVGVTMHSMGLGYDEAFAAIVKISQHTNQPVRDVAEWILHLGRVPDLT